MSVQTTPGALVDLGSAVLLLALALFVATVTPRRRANLAFAAFAGAFGMGFLAGNLLTPDDPLWFASGMASAAALGVAAVALLALALLFPAPLRPPRTRAFAAVAGVALVGLAWLWFGFVTLRNCLTIECRNLQEPFVGPFLHTAAADDLLQASFVVALLLLAVRYAQAEEPGRARTRRQLALVSAALLLYPGLRAGFDLSAPAFQPFNLPPTVPHDAALTGWGMVALLAVAAAQWLRISDQAHGAERRTARTLALLHVGLPFLGLLLAFPLGRWPEANNTGALGVARAASVLLLSYAILRYQLLGIDVQLKRTVRSGTVAGVFLGAYVLVSVLSQTMVEGAASTWLGLAAAGLLVLAILPLHRLADRVADRALPGVRDGSTDLARQRFEVYRAALEQAGDDSATESKVLAALRTKLGISEREAALLDAEVRAGAGRARPLGEGAVVLGKYRVEAVLGQGGFGTTLLAWDERVHRRVVLKIARASGPEEAKRQMREARVLARLGHPHVLTCYDVEEVGGEVVLVLEYAEGGSLADRLQRGALPVAEAVQVADDVLAALEAAHARDILHRDVKPGNILLTPEGRAKLADFGVAHAPAGSGTVTGLTTHGNPGSVKYMSPEQVRGRPLDARSDLYSAAVVLYEALAGTPYLDFEGRGEFEARLAILEEVPRLPLPGAPAALNRLLGSCLAKDPALRPASAGEVRRALAQARKAAPSRRGGR